MPTLHIEHNIVDFDLWRAAFDRFADLRRRSGVLAHRVRRPIDDPCYVIIDLEFATTENAKAFAHLLHERVWSSHENAPALVGDPQTRILHTAIDEPVTDGTTD